METVIFSFSVLTIVSLITFKTSKNQRKKYVFNCVAYLLIIMYALQIYALNHSTIFNLIATLIISIPILSCHGNVSEAWEEVKHVVKKFQTR